SRQRGTARARVDGRTAVPARAGRRGRRGEPRRRARARARDAVNLGRVGVWSNAPSIAPAAVFREQLAEVEALGFRAVWYPEGAGKESFSTAALLLAWSDRLVVAPGIANVYARDAMAAANG